MGMMYLYLVLKLLKVIYRLFDRQRRVVCLDTCLTYSSLILPPLRLRRVEEVFRSWRIAPAIFHHLPVVCSNKRL